MNLQKTSFPGFDPEFRGSADGEITLAIVADALQIVR